MVGVPEATDLSGRMSQVYDTGRALSAEVLAQWTAAVARHLADEGGDILYLGSGTPAFLWPLGRGSGPARRGGGVGGGHARASPSPV